eukprot:6184274-Pleurochrysis_carterae.AAC.1
MAAAPWGLKSVVGGRNVSSTEQRVVLYERRAEGAVLLQHSLGRAPRRQVVAIVDARDAVFSRYPLPPFFPLATTQGRALASHPTHASDRSKI